MNNSYDSREASVAESEQMSSGISHGLRGELDNESKCDKCISWNLCFSKGNSTH